LKRLGSRYVRMPYMKTKKALNKVRKKRKHIQMITTLFLIDKLPLDLVDGLL